LIVIAEFCSLEAIKAAVESGLGAPLISKRDITRELKKTFRCCALKGSGLNAIFLPLLQRTTGKQKQLSGLCNLLQKKWKDPH